MADAARAIDRRGPDVAHRHVDGVAQGRGYQGAAGGRPAWRSSEDAGAAGVHDGHVVPEWMPSSAVRGRHLGPLATTMLARR